MLTVLEIIKRTSEFLGAKGVASPRLNAELLIGHALGRNRMQLYLEFERPLTEAELAQLRPLVRRRAQHEPLQYIVGTQEFCGLKLKVDRRALIPRPETELLVELTLAWAAANPATQQFLDLGTGTGAIALAIAQKFPEGRVVAVDRSAPALALAVENAAAVGVAARVEFIASDWYAQIPPATFDVIVSNPPYLSTAEVAETSPEVREFEPREALAAEDEGFKDLEAVIDGATRYLRRGGLLALETGIAHHPRLVDRLTRLGFSHVESKPDLTGRDRFILAVW